MSCLRLVGRFLLDGVFYNRIAFVFPDAHNVKIGHYLIRWFTWMEEGTDY